MVIYSGATVTCDMKDRVENDRVRSARRLTAVAKVIAAGIAASSPAAAQTNASVPDPAQLLIQVPDPVDHHHRGEEARRLIEAKRWAEAEVVLRRMTSAYPFGTASAVHRSTWGTPRHDPA